jgi:Fe-S cluster biogenesis protein NfuA
VDREQVVAAVEEEARVLRADGADLLLVEADPKTARIHLRLELGGVHCEECVLPPDMLRRLIAESLQRRIADEFELVLDDPRRLGGVS